MPRTCYDSAFNVDKMPGDGDMYLGYINGTHTSGNYAEVKALFPGKPIRTVTVDGLLVMADIIDCENGDYTPATAALTAAWQHKQGKYPTIYGSRATYSQLIPELAKYGLEFGPDVDYLVSTLDGTETWERPGVIGVQYKMVDSEYDVSLIYSDSWYPTGPTPNPPVTTLTEEEIMTSFVDGSQQHVFAIQPNGSLYHWWYDATVPQNGWNKEIIPAP